MHKRHLLMYYDKRFQKDPHFPLIAFNHEQMKESTTAGYLTAERKSFHDYKTGCWTLIWRSCRLGPNEWQRGESQTWYRGRTIVLKLINDLDHVNGHVPGSITQKKIYEKWNLVIDLVFWWPSWFITFSCWQHASNQSCILLTLRETFSPELRPENERYRS